MKWAELWPLLLFLLGLALINVGRGWKAMAGSVGVGLLFYLLGRSLRDG